MFTDWDCARAGRAATAIATMERAKAPARAARTRAALNWCVMTVCSPCRSGAGEIAPARA
jgi:hypothetical protein